MEIARQLEAEGRVLIVAPESIGGMKTLKKDRDAICMMYEEGRKDGEAIVAFLRGRA